MSIKSINVIVKIKTESNKTARIIHTAINPDNVATPPMSLNSLYIDNNLIIKLKNIIRISTMQYTLLDLISSVQTAEKILEMSNND
ncbi:MAG: hypothetical protein ACXAC8_02045 [Candidatus Hodarchaeales archaeon]|jgi:tRNA threonylcarbamoyladenosine modification (KEOPS) complex  Pcc1 subunit